MTCPNPANTGASTHDRPGPGTRGGQAWKSPPCLLHQYWKPEGETWKRGKWLWKDKPICTTMLLPLQTWWHRPAHMKTPHMKGWEKWILSRKASPSGLSLPPSLPHRVSQCCSHSCPMTSTSGIHTAERLVSKFASNTLQKQSPCAQPPKVRAVVMLP